jgi:hypothetical protein
MVDIEKAVHQIQTARQDWEMIKLLWFDDITKENPEIKLYQFRRLLDWNLVQPFYPIQSTTAWHHILNPTPTLVNLLK